MNQQLAVWNSPTWLLSQCGAAMFFYFPGSGSILFGISLLPVHPDSIIMSTIGEQMSTKRGLIALSIQESSAGGTYYLVREDMLPEGVLKTVRAKQLLATGEAKTVYEAVERAGLSRSAFYKYKDGVHELNRHEQSRLATVSMELHHRSGVLSNVLLMIAAWQGNVLTIHQTIPLQGMANVVVTIDTSGMKESLGRLLEELRRLDGVKQADWIGHG
ncbi:hypothetical protein XYCOK13_29840 [Xylanibacillus composti]|uniref:UPF0735 ACT domain-containing protein XYCOK13_29840 n=2 Tax=Xylanibacillus composti TaxID=1572762 RepID=A0A8J4M3J0_9BACL|nr:hypothetical protein XYCOK13_29840 [Xylanibacillus composti]